MSAVDAGDGRRAFATRSLLTSEKEARQETTCRVCTGMILIGDPIRVRDWHIDQSHAACGWLRADEHDVHERRRPGTSFAYFEWRCPMCGLDACSLRKPRDDDNPSCRRCRPRPELAVGVTVETIVPHQWRVGAGRRPRMVRVPAYTRGVVLKVTPDIAHVQLEAPSRLLVWIRRLVLNTI